MNKRVNIVGKGLGTVVEQQKSFGSATKHVILFDSGAREAVQLSKGMDAKAPGEKFYIIE